MKRFRMSYTRNRRQRIIMTLAAIIVFVTTYALILPAITIDTDTAEKEPGIGIEEETAAETTPEVYPAQTLEGKLGELTVSVNAEEGALPADAALVLEEADDAEMLFAVEEAVESKVETLQAVSLSFADAAGEAVDLQNAVHVSLNTDLLSEPGDKVIVRVTEDGAEVLEDSALTYKQADFEADGGATFAVVEKSSITTEYLSADGNTYEATVTYDYTARIPEDAKLELTELHEESEQYLAAREAFLAAQEEAVDPETGEALPAPEMDIFDLSIRTPDGEEVEPATPVDVRITRKSLPGAQEEDAISEVTVQHLNVSGDAPFVETLDSAILTDGNTLTASFRTESFSYYTVSWRPNNQYRYARVHYGYMNGNTFVEFPNGTPAQTPAFSTSNDYAYLVYDIPDYQFRQAYYQNSNVSNVNNTRLNVYNATETSPEIRYNNSRWQYWDGNSWENMSYGTGTYRYSDLYMVYEPVPDPEPGGTPLTYESEVIDPEEPEMHKTSENNHDGTRTLTLSIDGHSTPIEVEKLADVIVVYDVSGSMNYNMSGTQTNNVPSADRRITIANQAVKDLAYELLSDEYLNREGNPQIRMSLITFSNVANVETLSRTDDPIYKNGELWQNYPDLHFTTDPDKFAAMIDGITPTGGTNWEQALQFANEMEVDPDRATFVIFVSDGDPTFRMTRSPEGTALTDPTLSNNDINNNYFRDYAVYGQGNSDNYDRNYQAALEQAKSIVQQGKRLYGIGISNSVSKMMRLTDEAGAGEKHSFLASNEEELKNAFADIKVAITAKIGWSDVSVTDGITGMTNLFAKTPIVGVDPESFVYKKIIKNQNGGVVQEIENWDPESERCGKAQYNPTTGAVEWDMGENFQLENNVTYEVSFKVWPDQSAIDIVTDLNNHAYSYDDLTPDQKEQIQLIDGVYTLKTNTHAGMSYYPSRWDGEGITKTGEMIESACTDEVEPLVMQTIPMELLKQWRDSFGDGEDRPSEVELYVDYRPIPDPGEEPADWEPLNLFMQDNGEMGNMVRLSESNNWSSGKFYVSPGLKDKDGVIREKGYEFRITEPDVEYHYELDGEKLNPLLEGYENPQEGQDENLATRQVYIIRRYNGDTDGNDLLTAANVVKGGITLRKVVVDPNGNAFTPDDTFTIRGWIRDKEGNPYTFDPANDDRVDKSHTSRDEPDAVLFNEHQNDPIVYHTYDRNGKRTGYKLHFDSTENIELHLKGGESVRFPIVPADCTYEFWEVNDATGDYQLIAVSGTAEEKDENDVYQPIPDELAAYNPVVGDNNEISGKIRGNTLFTLTFTNQYTVDEIHLQVRKADAEDPTLFLNGAKFMLYEDEAHTIPAVNAEGNPVGEIVTASITKPDGTTEKGLGDIGHLSPGTYYLVETSPPPGGYKTLPDHVVVTVGEHGVTILQTDNAAGTAGEGTTYEGQGVVTFIVTNTLGAELPSTGGPGTFLYTSGGIVLIATAALIYIFSFRRRKGGKYWPEFP